MKPTDENNEKPAVVLSGNTPIHVKFIGWLVIVCAGGFGAWVWWAASMSTKLDIVISNQATQLAAIREVVQDVSRLKEWRIQIDTVGSPMIVKRVDDLSRQFLEISRELELHKVETKTKP